MTAVVLLIVVPDFNPLPTTTPLLSVIIIGVVLVEIIDFKFVVEVNILLPFILSKLSPTYRLVKLLQEKNILLIFVTLLVLKLLTSRLGKLLQELNILLILVTLLVSKLLTSRLGKLLQEENIELMSVTLLVLKLLTSKFVKLLQT